MGRDFKRLCLKCLTEAVQGGRCQRCGAPVGFAQEPSFALIPGTIIDGRYLVGGVLGFGGFGITYLGLDLADGEKSGSKRVYALRCGREDSRTHRGQR